MRRSLVKRDRSVNQWAEASEEAIKSAPTAPEPQSKKLRESASRSPVRTARSHQVEDREGDREWYDRDEEDGVIDLEHNPLLSLEGDARLAAKQANAHRRLDRKAREAEDYSSGLMTGKRLNLKLLQYSRDNHRWESNRLRGSGITIEDAKPFDPNMDDDHQQSHSTLLVHDQSPPFLTSESSVSSQRRRPLSALGLAKESDVPFDPVLPVRDPSGDMALLSRKGSAVVKAMRERKERARKMRTLEGAGSTLHNLTAGKEEKASVEAATSVSFANRASPFVPPTTSERLTLKQQREFLPAFACRSALLRIIHENQITVVVGETGSGKTTQLTQYLHEAGYSRNGMIGCTQPRRVAAMSVAKRVSEEMGVKLGDEVGYAIRFEDVTSTKTVIKYMTDGVLLRETLRDPEADTYSAIIIDEAHERSLQTDVLLGLLRQIVVRRRDLRVIITSATMNADRFSEFFGGAPIYTIPGRTFPVEILFSKTPSEDYVDAAVKQAISIHTSRPGPGDILIFMTGQEDVDATAELLRERLHEMTESAKSAAIAANVDLDSPQAGLPPPIAVLPIYSQLPADMQAKIFEPAPSGERKCIVATNIAETSLTVDGIVYVIDTGFAKIKVYNPRIGMDALQIAPISQAAANQRAGRAGRTGPGIAVRLYTESAYRTEFFSNNIPEILRTNLANVVLLLKSLGVVDLLSFDFIDPPPDETMRTSLSQLWLLGALNDIGDLTSIGKAMVEFPLDPPLSKMVLSAVKQGCVDEVVTIVSMLSVPSIFYRPKERAEESDAAREKFLVPESDHLTLLNVFRQWIAHGSSDTWCIQHFIHPKALRRAQEVREQLLEILRQQRMQVSTIGSDWDRVRRCLASAYVHKAARVKGIGEYVNLRSGMPCHLHPTSALYGLGHLPDYTVYHELVLTSKEFMQCVTAVDPAWLADAAPMLYTLRVTEWGLGTAKSKILGSKRHS